MTIHITHAKVSGKPASSDPTKIDGPAWDDDHEIVGLGDASETEAGVVELATAAEATTGTDTARAVTPAGLQANVTAGLSAYSLQIALHAQAFN